MANILYLVHRLPYPPNKGDKVRSYNLLKHLARQHRVWLGTFIDDPDDEQYVGRLDPLCAGTYIARLSPRTAKLRSMAGLLSGEALSLPYYRDAGLQAWVKQTLAQAGIDAIVVFSSPMAQYVPATNQLPLLVDFVDADSAKWTQYATTHAWPMSWVYRREGERLLAFERATAARAKRSFFVTDAEVALFTAQAPEAVPTTDAVCNGVDAEFFSPQHELPTPFAAGETALVFTGAMDYWPNIDAVQWFAADILPALRQRRPDLRLYIVGRSPTTAVQQLENEAVVVTGTVPDVRPYLHHAALVAAPLRIARGVQNKVLEAMAMGRPVVTSRTCAQAVDAVVGRDFLAAENVDDYVAEIDALLADPQRAAAMGEAARRQVLARYSWEAHLSRIDSYLPTGQAQPEALNV